MSDPSTFVQDAWSALSYKRTVAEVSTVSRVAPTWVGTANQRRLAALCVLRAYLDNVARVHLAATLTIPSTTNADLATVLAGATDSRKNHREYGDAGLLVATAVDALLGEDVQIVVPGAGDDPPDAPEVPEEPADPGPAASTVVRRLFEVQHARWEERANGAIDEWQRALDNHEAAVERQAWLRDAWADPEQFIAKVYEESVDSVGLGDGVYHVAWSSGKRRPRVTVYDPGFYFPVLGDGAEEDFPRRSHIAWEFEDDEQNKLVRRITWQMGPIRPRVDDAGEPLLEGDQVVLHQGDVLAADGRITRRYPWQAADEDPSDLTCYMTDGVWKLDELRARRPDDFDLSKAAIQRNEDGVLLRDFDLHHDFLPLVHVPNTPASKEHWGRSLLLTVAQLLDDIQATDTDLAAASATTGVPPIVLKGHKESGVLAVRPGQVWSVGEEGGLDVLDTSQSLTALRSYLEALLDRLATNSRIPSEVLGRVKASEVPSGIAVVVLWGPLRGLVRAMRLTRKEKHPLVLKFVQRLAQIGGVLPAGPDMRAEIAYGSFLPSDRTAIISDIRSLFEAKLISRQTGLQMLVDDGILSVDVADELSRVEAEDFEAALQLLDATGDETAVRDHLGLQGPGPRPEGPPPPAPELPPVPGPPAPAPPVPPAG